MARLPRLQRDTAVTAKGDMPSPMLMRYVQRLVEAIEAEFGAIEAAQAAQAAAEVAQTAADTAEAAATAAQGTADAAQAAADAAQAAVDSIVVPPSNTLSVSTNTALTPDDVTVLVDATGGAVTITLSSASGYSVPVVITKSDSSGNAVNIVPSGGDTLNLGAGPISLTSGGETRTFVADQVSQWFA